MSENLLTLTIDGHEVKASADSSIIQAYARSGSAITANGARRVRFVPLHDPQRRRARGNDCVGV